VPLVRVEDGFVRSVGLGVDLVPPSSVVVDASGIHFDPRGASDLETLLAHGDMPASLLARGGLARGHRGGGHQQICRRYRGHRA
jgi:capsular polysaccharide export protein